MKILFVINQLDCGGAEQQLVTLCEGLRQRHHDIEVVTIYDRLALKPRLTAVGIPVTVAHKYGKLDVAVVWRLRKIILKSRPDLIHAYLPASSLFAGMTKWTGVSVPVIQSERSINSWRSRYRIRLDGLVRRRVAAITCNAEAIRKQLIEREHAPADKIALIYNGLVSERRQRPAEALLGAARETIAAPAGSFIVTAVANFVEEKQHHVMLEAFAQAKGRADKLFLLLIGSGELEARVRGLIESLGLQGSAQIIADCANPLPFLCVSDAAMLTSSIEGCSNALIEAMAAGLPIVVTDAGGNKELVTDGRGGIVCPVGDVNGLADGIVRLWQRPAERAVMAAYNRQRVESEFTDTAMVEHTLALYERILKRSAVSQTASASRVSVAAAETSDR